ncbi:MAG: hypothetical protein HQL54_04655 [Magnetococcales bacterium]|nr:hypothetical protein [Magnetococcales bacterium]
MIKLWKRWANSLDRLQRRERILIAMSFSAGMLFGWDQLLLTPMWEEMNSDKKAQQETRVRIQALRARQPEILARANLDPDKEARRLEEEFREALRHHEKELAELSATMMTPDLMIPALEVLIERMSNLDLMLLEALPPEDMEKVEQEQSSAPPKPKIPAPVANKDGNKNKDSEIGLDESMDMLFSVTGDLMAKQGGGEAVSGFWRHGVRLVVQGDYLNSVAFLKGIAELPYAFYWDSFDFSIKKYPTARLEIILYTLSMDKEFLGA